MLKNIHTLYIIGIGGISLSAIALMLKDKGYNVRGSDMTQSELTDKLKKNGIKVVIGSAPKFAKECDAVIITGAIREDNKDLILAKKLDKKIYTRAEILGMLSSGHRLISVAGTHGKTTTTGMISSILLYAGLDPTIHIGGILGNINSNLKIGRSDIFVTEACEYKDSFLSLKNHVAVVLNVQEDHLDYFKNLDNIYQSFNKFIENTDKNGVIIYNFDEFDQRLQLSGKNCISFGISGGDVVARDISEYTAGKFAFNLYFRDNFVCKISLPCYGYHNIKNALASSAAALFLGVSGEDIAGGLQSFQGIKRRFEIINEKPVIIIHDYAHHPEEIKATLAACREIKKDGHIIAIFQPHTYTRTRDLLEEFSQAFSMADQVWLLPIYPAREKPIKGINSRFLAEKIKKNGKKVRYFADFEHCRSEIVKNLNNADLFILLGAGDIEHLAYSLKGLE